MAEGIVIEVSDGVAASIQTKIRGIGSEARDANAHVEKLRQAIGSLGNSDPVTRLQTEMLKLQTAQARLAQAMAQSQSATTQAATATQRLQAAQTATATAAARLATAQQQTATATINAATAATRGQTAALQLQQAQQRLATTTTTAAGAMGTFLARFIGIAVVIGAAKAVLGMADAYTVLQNKLGTVSTSIAQTNELTANIYGIAQRTSVEIGTVASAFTRFDRALLPLGKSQADVLRMTETVNKALLIGGATTQEAAGALLQLSQGFNAGKLQGDEFRSVSENMPSLIKAIGDSTGWAADKIKKYGSDGKITSEVIYNAVTYMQKSTDAAFDKMQKTMGQASVNMKNSIMNAFGEVNTAVGFTAALANGTIALSKALDEFTARTMAGDNQVLQFLTSIGDLWKVMKEMYDLISNQVVQAFRDYFHITEDANGSSSLLEIGLKALVDSLRELLTVGNEVNYFFNRLNNNLGTAQEKIVAITRGNWGKLDSIREASDARGIVDKKTYEDFKTKIANASNTTKPDAYSSMENRRMRELAGRNKTSNLRPTGPRTQFPSGDDKKKKGERKKTPAEEYNLIEKKYTDEIASLGMLKPLREDKNALDEIELQLLRKNIVLTDAGRTALQGYITTVREGKVVQQEMDRIYEATVGPAREYAATLKASDILLGKGTISQKQYNEEMSRAKQKLDEFNDPFLQYNKALDDEIRLLGFTGTALEVETRMMAIRNELTKKGLDLTREDNKAQLEALEIKIRQTQQEELRKKIAEVDKGLGAPNSTFEVNAKVSEINRTGLDQLRLMEEGRAAGILSEEAYALRVLEIRRKSAQDIRDIELARTTAQLQLGQETFDSLAGLTEAFAGKQNVVYKTMFAASKAMAIAQSLIKIQAAMAEALALPWPANLGAMAMVAAQGMSIMANIRAVKEGFQAGGYTGSGATDAVAGVVHGQEFVMNAAATRRNRPMLEAMNRGAEGVATNDGQGGNGATKVVMLNFEVNNNIQTSGGKGDSEADGLAKAAETISRKTQADIMDSIRMGGVWSKVIKQ
ncbi:MAG: hypothetical protein JWR85_4175 [Marmoricola sp.]|nr:hypothetical protein [Marmoricola sp.]